MRDADAANTGSTRPARCSQRRCKSGKIEDFMPSGVTPVAINYAISDPRHRDLTVKTAGLNRSFGTANRKTKRTHELLGATHAREVALAVSSLATRLAQWHMSADHFGLERPNHLRHGQLQM